MYLTRRVSLVQTKTGQCRTYGAENSVDDIRRNTANEDGKGSKRVIVMSRLVMLQVTVGVVVLLGSHIHALGSCAMALI